MEMTRNRRSAWQQWLLGAAALAVALVVGELVCRLALPRPGFVAVSGNSFPGAIEPHPTRLYQLVPIFSGVVRRGTFGEMGFATNAEGLRERPLSVVRRARVRILSIGDSFTFGTGINQEDTWPTQLERLLNRRAADSDAIAVINAGVPAYGFTQLRDLTEEILPKVDPQIMLLGVYTGGFDRMNDPFTALGDFVIRRSQRPSASRAVPDGFVISRITREPATSIDLWLEAHTYLGAYLFEAANEVRGRMAQ